MKHKKSLKETLGIPQEELAALLGVTRSQLSMYESGKRELPLTAIIELTGMLTYMGKARWRGFVIRAQSLLTLSDKTKAAKLML